MEFCDLFLLPDLAEVLAPHLRALVVLDPLELVEDPVLSAAAILAVSRGLTAVFRPVLLRLGLATVHGLHLRYDLRLVSCARCSDGGRGRAATSLPLVWKVSLQAPPRSLKRLVVGEGEGDGTGGLVVGGAVPCTRLWRWSLRRNDAPNRLPFDTLAHDTVVAMHHVLPSFFNAHDVHVSLTELGVLEGIVGLYEFDVDPMRRILHRLRRIEWRRCVSSSCAACSRLRGAAA